MNRAHPRDLFGLAGAIAAVVLVRVLDARTDLDVRGAKGLAVVAIGFVVARWAWRDEPRR